MREIYSLASENEKPYMQIAMSDPIENRDHIVPLEIHPRRGGFKLGYLFGILFFLFFIWGILSSLHQRNIWLSVLFMWAALLVGFVGIDSFRKANVKGPVFSFSKHGFVDHRVNPARIYTWDKVEDISWTRHSVKGVSYKLLKVNISELTPWQKIGKLFLHHPFEINSRQVDFQSPTEFEKALAMALPKGKLKS